MRKYRKKTPYRKLVNKLDKICGEIVRGRGRCQKCDKVDATLQTAHIFSRSKMSIRWDIEYNLVCLCYYCHQQAHSNPIFFTEWVKEFLGPYRYRVLKKRARTITSWSVYELEELLKILERIKGEVW